MYGIIIFLCRWFILYTKDFTFVLLPGTPSHPLINDVTPLCVIWCFLTILFSLKIDSSRESYGFGLAFLFSCCFNHYIFVTGFAERLERELRALVPEHTRVRIVAPPERKFLSWIGGSFLASLSTFQNQWITQEMYQEYGPSVIHRQCANV